MQQSSSFGAWLKQRRRDRDLTQQALAEQVGCAAESIRKIEADKLRPSHTLAERLATALMVPRDAHAALLTLARMRTATASPSLDTERALMVDTSFPTPPSLPMPRTALVGRAADVAQLTALLGDNAVRFMTLVGPPGVGKTRLAIAVAAALTDGGAASVSFVPLASVRHANDVLPMIARTLNLSATPAGDLAQMLTTALRAHPVLLVLDTMEHLSDAAHQLAQLLDGAPRLTLLVTSRAPLHLVGEHVWSVAPLPAAEGGPAVDLFVQRARAACSDFALDAANAATVAELCTCLDGLPLAIELAAARITILSPAALLHRMDQRLDLLIHAPLDADVRHHTLRHAIAWSYALLDASCQALLRRLSVFDGGCRLEAAQTVCIDRTDDSATALSCYGPHAVLEQLTLLVEHSLVQQVADIDGEPRFTLLASIHAFAREQLDAASETALLTERHAQYYGALVMWIEPLLDGPDYHRWLQVLDAELPNIRAALARSCGTVADGGLSLSIATALVPFWWARGAFQEGRMWLDQALAREIPAASLRPLALARAGMLAALHGDYGHAATQAAESLDTASSDDTQSQAIALGALGIVAHAANQYDRARRYYQESAERAASIGAVSQHLLMLERLGMLALKQGDQSCAVGWFERRLQLDVQHHNGVGSARALHYLGHIALWNHNYAHAQTCFERGLAQARTCNTPYDSATMLCDLGELARARRHYLQAAVYYQESCMLWQGMGQSIKTAAVRHNLGHVALQMDDAAGALHAFLEGMQLFWDDVHDQFGAALCLAGCAGAMFLRRQPVEAIRLFAAAAAARDTLGAMFEPPDQAAYERYLTAARAQLDDAIFQAAWRDGYGWSLAQAIAAVQAVPVLATSTPSTRTTRYPAGLTVREAEVLQLLAHGLTNAQIAARLVINSSTVNCHIHAVYRKLNVASRSAATRFAVERGLV